MNHDDIFKVDRIGEDFEFNERVAEVFDDMLDRSVPSYTMVVDMVGQLLEMNLQSGDTVYDLGCSTGTTLIMLAGRLQGMKLVFVGIDSSPAMISKATVKAELHSRADTIHFREQDIMDAVIDGAGAVILNYTLQFVRPLLREEFLRKVHRSLRPGGLLIVSEKIICQDSLFNREFIECHHQYKKERGYSELEIARKREALENVLIPFTSRENENLLQKAGFSSIEKFFQWFNFASFVAVK
jgi:tRNA (cmo5U34)-methyltransferase